MESRTFFLDDAGHLRSGWRLAIFAVAFLICAQLAQLILLAGLVPVTNRPFVDLTNSIWNLATNHAAILISAMLVGWACGALFEELPFRALGCSPRDGWL